MNIFQNFVPNKIISIREKDAPWMTSEIKRLILEKAKVYVKNGRNAIDSRSLREMRTSSKVVIKQAKDEYYIKLGNSLNDHNIGQNKYWSILQHLLNNRKLPQIPPICHNNSIITNISEKTNIFNSFFAE